MGGYDEALLPPPEARDELEAHRRRIESASEDAPPPAESLGQLPSMQPAGDGSSAGPEIIARPLPAGSAAGFTAARDGFRPSSFVELLDASLVSYAWILPRDSPRAP
jgi:hypothetical protein